MRYFATFILIVSASFLQAGSSAELDRGIKAFQSGDFKQAVEVFAQAEKAAPTDPRIVYNLGAAQAAAGNFDDAVETLRKAALVDDVAVASKSLVLLGDISVAQAKLRVAPKPEETPDADRRASFAFLDAAEKSFGEAAELEPSVAETMRRNIEQIRSWKNRMEAEWNRFDRDKKRRELSLPQRFDWIEQVERGIRTKTKRIAAESQSPKKYQELYEASKTQQEVVEELPPLKETLRQALAREDVPENGAGVRRNVASLVAAVDKIAESATATRESLRNFQNENAVDGATKTVERLDYLRNALSPFEEIVQNAEKKQEALCKANPSGSPVPPTDAGNVVDLAEQAWEQGFIDVWTPLFVGKAKQQLAQIDEENETSKRQPEDDSERNSEERRAENLRRAMELAVQYGPEIESAAAEAAQLLSETKSADALPKQRRALELLREILKPLQQDDKQKNQQNDSQNDQQNRQQQQNQQQNSQDRQNGKDDRQQNQADKDHEQQQKQQQGNEEKQSSETPDDAKNAGKDQRKAESEQQRDEGSPQEKDLTSREKKEELEKAQRMLRQVKRRQQEVDEKREKVRALLMQLEPVEKDW